MATSDKEASEEELQIDISRPSWSEVERKKWKYMGYRQFCDFVASDNDFFILRKFGTLSIRVLLALQDELSELEEQLEILEGRLAAKDAPDVHNGSFRQETSATRLELIRTIHLKLKDYNELVIQHSDLRARPRVPQKDATSVSNWFYNNKNAILDDETKYIDHQKDLFAVVPKAKTPLRNLLEQSSYFRLLRIWRKPPAADDEHIHYISDRRIDMFVALITTIVGLTMLIAPLWILAFVDRAVYQLALITTCVVVFLCFVSFTTVARPFETLGAAAAYAAVLVVFLQNTPSGSARS